MVETTNNKKAKKKYSPSIEFSFGNIRIRLAETVAITAGLLAAIGAIIALAIGGSLTRNVDSLTVKLVEERIDSLAVQLKDDVITVQKDFSAIKDEFNKLTTLSPDAKIASKISQLENSVSELDHGLKSLEKVILDNPTKALEMPLLSKDVDNLKVSYQSEILALRQEVSRVYDLNKWFIGLMFTMAIGIIGLAVTNFIKTGKLE